MGYSFYDASLPPSGPCCGGYCPAFVVGIEHDTTYQKSSFMNLQGLVNWELDVEDWHRMEKSLAVSCRCRKGNTRVRGGEIPVVQFSPHNPFPCSCPGRGGCGGLPAQGNFSIPNPLLHGCVPVCAHSNSIPLTTLPGGPGDLFFIQAQEIFGLLTSLGGWSMSLVWSAALGDGQVIVTDPDNVPDVVHWLEQLYNCVTQGGICTNQIPACGIFTGKSVNITAGVIIRGLLRVGIPVHYTGFAGGDGFISGNDGWVLGLLEVVSRRASRCIGVGQYEIGTGQLLPGSVGVDPFGRPISGILAQVAFDFPAATCCADLRFFESTRVPINFNPSGAVKGTCDEPIEVVGVDPTFFFAP